MFNDHDNDDEPAVAVVTTSRGGVYDMKNIPGFKRKQLIESGEISIDRVVQMDNIPGSKLKEMRDRFRKNNPNFATSGATGDSTSEKVRIEELTVGTMVSYRNTVTEVEKINTKDKKVYISTGDGKKKWVAVAKLKVVVTPNDEE